METVTNAVNAASKAIWGDTSAAQSGTEPVSGEAGPGTVNEPYDQGNLASQAGTTGEVETAAKPTPDAGPPLSVQSEGTSKPASSAVNTYGPPSNTAIDSVFTTKAEPDVRMDSSSVDKTETDLQGSGNPLEESSGSQSAALKEDKELDEAEKDKPTVGESLRSTEDRDPTNIISGSAAATDGADAVATKPLVANEAKSTSEPVRTSVDNVQSKSSGSSSSPSGDKKHGMDKLKEKLHDKLHIHHHKKA